MTGELNTEVASDPASCRAMAGWLTTLSLGVYDTGNAIYRAREASESGWQGAAANAFRHSLAPMGRDADQLVEVINQARRALDVFADEIDTVGARLAQARQVAVAARLIVTPTAILPPGPGPGAPPVHSDGPGTPQAETRYRDAVTAYEAAVAGYEARIAAFTEVSITVAEARHKETEAHHTLDAAMDQGRAGAKGLNPAATALTGAALGAVQNTQAVANNLIQQADKIRDHADRMQALAVEPTATQAVRSAATRAAAAAQDGQARTRAQAERLQRPISWIPESARQRIAASPGEYIKDGKGWVGLGKSAARGVPFVGAGTSVVFGMADVASGKPVGQVAAETGAGLGGGVIGGMAGATIGSAIFPGVGTVIGGVVGGIIGSMTATDGVTRAMGDNK